MHYALLHSVLSMLVRYSAQSPTCAASNLAVRDSGLSCAHTYYIYTLHLTATPVNLLQANCLSHIYTRSSISPYTACTSGYSDMSLELEWNTTCTRATILEIKWKAEG